MGLYDSYLYNLALRDKHSNPWDYADDVSPVSQYFNNARGQSYLNSRNLLGISKKSNPFSKYNLSSASNGSIGTSPLLGTAFSVLDNIQTGDPRGLWDTLDPMYHLAGGRESPLGNAFSDAGVAMTKAGLQSGNLPLAGLGALVKTGGGLINSAIGIKENKENVNFIKNNTSNALNAGKSFNNARTTQQVLGAAGNMVGSSGFNWKDLYTNGWATREGTRKGNALIGEENNALAYQASALNTAAKNADKNQDDMVLSNFGSKSNLGAFGGYLGDIDPSTPIGYSLYTDKYTRDINRGKGTLNMFSGVPKGLFAFGGNVQTKGNTWSDGLVHIGTGGTHEQNPYDGVQVGTDKQGVPNLVEEDEVIYDDYVFSNRLKVPRGKRGRYGKRNKYAKGGKLDVGSVSINDYQDKVLKPYLGMTFADAATKAEKISGVLDRPNDPIATRGFRSILEVLATLQEKEREKEKLAQMQQAIDQMSPEELAAFQQQAQEQQAQEQQAQEQQMMATQQQAQYPQEQYPQEEQAYMQQQGIPEEEQYAMAALGGPIYRIGEMLDTQNVYPNMFATGGAEDIDPNWYNKLPRESRWLVDTYGLQNQDELDAMYSYYGPAIENLLNGVATINNDNATLSGIFSGTNGDYNLMKAIEALGYQDNSFKQLTKDDWKAIYDEYRRQQAFWEQEHPYIPFTERFQYDESTTPTVNETTVTQETPIVQNTEGEDEAEQRRAFEEKYPNIPYDRRMDRYFRRLWDRDYLGYDAKAAEQYDNYWRNREEAIKKAQEQETQMPTEKTPEQLAKEIAEGARSNPQNGGLSDEQMQYFRSQDKEGEFLDDSPITIDDYASVLPTVEETVEQLRKDVSPYIPSEPKVVSPIDKSILTKILAYNNIDEKTWAKKSPKAKNKLADKYEKSLKTQEEKDAFEKGYYNFITQANASIKDSTYQPDIPTEAIDAERKQIQAQREVDRLYRKRGQDPKTLTGSAAALHDEDVKKVQEDPSLLKKDPQKKLAANKIGKRSPETFSAKAETIVVNNARDAFLTERPLNENGRLNIKYNDEGTIPQGLTSVKNRISYNDKTKQWEDAQGNRIDNPYTNEYGFSDVARDWSRYGYLNPKDNSWTDVEYNPPVTASGNTDYKYAPWNEWFKQSGMDADQYESQEAYLNNYLDFLDDIYNEDSPNHQAALKRLYEMGEASKSNAPGELKGKNRYFDVDEGFDINNLSLGNLRLIDGNNTIGGSRITGYSKYNKKANEASSNKQYYVNKDGALISPDKYEELDDSSKKNWTPLNHKGLTREDVLGHLKAVRNSDYAREPQDLLYNSMFDNVPAQSYLMAPNGTRRYVYVDKQGNFLRDANNNIREINFDPNATYQYYNEGKPLEGQSQFIDGVNIDTIGVLGGNVENHIGVRRNPDGTWRTFELSPEDVEKVKQREILSNDERYKTLPQFEKAVEGYTFTPHYYELDDDAYKSLGFDAKGHKIDEVIGEDGPLFPKMPTCPIDYSNADALIKASKEAGNFVPVDFRPIGDYLTYKPLDIWYGQNKLNAQARSAERAILNSGANQGTQIGGLMANAYNTGIQSGNLYRQGQEYNDALAKQTGEFNKDTSKFNSEGFLKAGIASQDAASRAAGYKLEGQKAAYAMRQALEDDKSKAISAGISGIGSALMAMADTKYKNDLLGWSTYNNAYGPMSGYEGRWTRTPSYHGAYGGKLKKRRRRGLDF